MALEQAYYISQITAVIVLIISIVFLALQVRQNTKMMQRSMIDDWHMNQNAVNEDIYRSREIADLHMKIGTDYDGLDDIDKHRALFLGLKNVRNLMSTVQAYVDGDLADNDWLSLKSRIRYASTRRNAHDVWKLIKSDLTTINGPVRKSRRLAGWRLTFGHGPAAGHWRADPLGQYLHRAV